MAQAVNKERYVLEIHPGRRKRKPFGSEYAPYRTYWKYTGSKEDVTARQKKLRRKGYKTLTYPGKVGRSSNYRAVYFQAHEPDITGRYQCVYCGRRQPKEKITIDHVIPIGVAKKSRHLQKKFEYTGINTPSNLVASCARCNKRKGASYSVIWRLRARLGRHPWYFRIRRMMQIVILVTVCSLMYIWYVNGFPETEDLLRILMQW